jgi:hypothetical protein
MDIFVGNLARLCPFIAYMDPPALQGQCLLMAARDTTARLYPASLLERLCPPRHDGICALPPQQFADLGRSLR